MKPKGGARPGAGRKSKADEEKTKDIFVQALQSYYNVKDPSQAKHSFVHDLATTDRGKLFIAEHIFGKPKETIDSKVTLTNFSIKDVLNFKPTEQANDNT